MKEDDPVEGVSFGMDQRTLRMRTDLNDHQQLLGHQEIQNLNSPTIGQSGLSKPSPAQALIGTLEP